MIRVCVPLKDNMESSERKYSKQDCYETLFGLRLIFCGLFKASVFLTIFAVKVTALPQGSTYNLA